MKFPKLGGESRTIKKGCKFNRETGEFHCQKKAVNKDGTEVTLAEISGGLDGQCNPSFDVIEETEDGGIEDLHKEFTSRIIGKCKNKPSDY